MGSSYHRFCTVEHKQCTGLKHELGLRMSHSNYIIEIEFAAFNVVTLNFVKLVLTWSVYRRRESGWDWAIECRVSAPERRRGRDYVYPWATQKYTDFCSEWFPCRKNLSIWNLQGTLGFWFLTKTSTYDILNCGYKNRLTCIFSSVVKRCKAFIFKITIFIKTYLEVRILFLF